MRRTNYVLVLFFVCFYGVMLSEFSLKEAYALGMPYKKDSIVAAAKEIRKKDKISTSDITYLMDEYIDMDGGRECVENYLKSLDFIPFSS